MCKFLSNFIRLQEFKGVFKQIPNTILFEKESPNQAYRSLLVVLQNLESHWQSLRLQGDRCGIERYIKDFCNVPATEDVNKDSLRL